MKTRILILLASLLAISSYFAAQNTDNMVYAKQFPGATVSAQIAAAQEACNLNSAIPCLTAGTAQSNLQAAVDAAAGTHEIYLPCGTTS